MGKVKGKCSICGGRVVEPDVWYGAGPAVAQCENCHAVEAGRGPVIDMVPLRQPALVQPLYVPYTPSFPHWIPVDQWPWWKMGEVICGDVTSVDVNCHRLVVR